MGLTSAREQLVHGTREAGQQRRGQRAAARELKADVLNILSLLASISGAAAGTALPPLALGFGVVSLILAGVIVYLLWQRPASEWFDAMSRGSATSA
ncbi:MAG: hypothetical protein WKF99_11035 [Solirubrobacteraceae bacterium]